MNTKMKGFISSLLAMTLAFGVSVNVSATQFADTSGHWALTSIDKWSDLGVMNGYDGLFRPNDPVTLAEFSVILCQIMGYTKTSSARLADVDDQYYATAIRKMVAAGILSPDRERNIYPEANLTRHGMATMLARALNISPQKGGTSFIDDDSIPDYAKGYVKALRDKGYLAGYSTDRGYEFRPHNNLTRAEAIVLIEQLASVLVNSPGTYAENVNGNLVVNTGGVTLSNLTVSGDLYLAEGIAEGDVRLENVTVEGEMFVRGGGVNSIYIVDSNIGTMVVDKSDGDIRIVATGTTKVWFWKAEPLSWFPS